MRQAWQQSDSFQQPTWTSVGRLTAQAFVCSFLVLTSLLLAGCGGGDGGTTGAEGTNGGSGGSASSGPIALSLAWNPVPDSTVSGYYIHYGRYSPNSPGSCNYESNVFVSSAEGTVTSLNPDTRYYFAVSAYNGLQSTCSSEISTVTPSSQT
ncbi:MAG: hypothetical protein GDA67_11130 [Nitrospira sp. CR1.3]|nr:hypothetical protein [Nitrospira sp. CR1.3]